MSKKRLIGFLVIIIVVAMGIVIMKFVNKRAESTESIKNTENMEDVENMEDAERTDEEYIAVLLGNKEDFDYIAEMMMQWPKRSAIDFDKDGVSSDSQEITDEMSNNQEFYEHLENLYNLNEIWFIIKEGDRIVFYFNKPPKNYHGGWYYWEDTEKGGLMKTAVIDEHWTLEMLPNI